MSRPEPFSEKEIITVLCCCAMAASDLIGSGFKEPLLSPKSILITEEGYIKVGEWEFTNCQPPEEEGEVLLTTSLNHNKGILMNYYWAPEGLAVIEEMMSLGNDKKSIKKGQIFSLGMTII